MIKRVMIRRLMVSGVLWLSTLILSPLLWAQAVMLEVTGTGTGTVFQVNFIRGATAERIAATRAGMQFWADRLYSSVPIRVSLQFLPLTCTSDGVVLGGAASVGVQQNTANIPVMGVWYPQALADSYAGVDLDSSNADIDTMFNSTLDDDPNCLGGIGWSYDTSTLSIETNRPTYYQTLIHEIAHGLGFSSFFDASTGELLNGSPDIYSTFLRDEQADIDNITLPRITDAQRLSATTSDGNLVWKGGSQVNTVANDPVNGLRAGLNAGKVRMFAPNPIQLGSSVSHFDTVLDPNEVMEPFSTDGFVIITLTEALFEDIGWRTTTPTLPSSNTVNANGALTSVNIIDNLGLNLPEGATLVALTLDGVAIDNPADIADIVLTSGMHDIAATIQNADGTTTNFTQTINVIPRVDFTIDQVVGAGSNFNLVAELSGSPVNYPVAIPFTISNNSTAENPRDHNAVAGTITITSGLTGMASFTTTANATNRSTITFVMGNPINANPTGSPMHTVTIVTDNTPPRVNPTLSQGGSSVSVISIGAGNTTIAANATDINSGQTLSYDWSQSASELIAGNTDTTQASLIINPSNLSAGRYRLEVTVTDDGSSPTSTTVRRDLVVVTGSVVVVDSNGDGVPDANDVPLSIRSEFLPTDTLNRPQALMMSEAGTSLRAGSLTASSGTGATLLFEQLPNIAIQNVGDFNTQGTQVFDYGIDRLSFSGESINVVLPLNTAILPNSRLRKYDITSNQWRFFQQDDNNHIYTAVASNPNGICPAVNDPLYQLVAVNDTLPEGHWCLQLRIQDGGMNDNDDLVNGLIIDPVSVQSAIQSTVQVNAVEIANNTSVSSGENNVVMLVFTLSSNSDNTTINEFTFTANGQGNDATAIASVNLYTDPNADADISDGVQIGSGVYNTNNGTVTMNLSTPLSVNATPSQYILTYNFN